MLLLLRLACGKRVTGTMAYKPRTEPSEISGEIDWVNQNPALNFGGLLLAGLDAHCTLWGTSTLWDTKGKNFHANAYANAASAHAQVRRCGGIDRKIIDFRMHKRIMLGLPFCRQAKYSMQVLSHAGIEQVIQANVERFDSYPPEQETGGCSTENPGSYTRQDLTRTLFGISIYP